MSADASPSSGADPRVRAFAALFALGVVAHELEFGLEQELMGPLGSYLENWRRAIPTVSWTSATGLALHAANIVLAVIAAFSPRPRAPLAALAVTFVLSQLASPERVASHSGLAAFGLLIVSGVGLAEALTRIGRPRPAVATGDWDRWTLSGLAGIAVLTYSFAFFYKLTPAWFSGASPAPQFLLHPGGLVLDRLGVSPDRYQPVLAAMAIYGGVAFELLLPLLIVWPATRLLACFVGIVFHLPMVAQGVTDFPMLMIAFYPAILRRDQLRTLVARAARPSMVVLAGTALLSVFGVSVIDRAPKLHVLAGQSAVPNSPLSVINGIVTSLTFVLFAYLAFVIGTWLLELWRTPVGSPASEPEERRTPVKPAATRAAAAVVAMVWAGFFYINLAPFFGLPSAGAMTMYSGISPTFSDHLIMPRISGPDRFSFAEVIEFEAAGTQSPEARDFRAFVKHQRAPRGSVSVSVNVLRYQMDRICRADPSVVVNLTWRLDNANETFSDLCAHPAMRRHTLLFAGRHCQGPNCDELLREWARQGLDSE